MVGKDHGRFAGNSREQIFSGLTDVETGLGTAGRFRFLDRDENKHVSRL